MNNTRILLDKKLRTHDNRNTIKVIYQELENFIVLI